MYFFLESNLIKEIKVHVQEKPVLGGEIQTQLKETVFLERGCFLFNIQNEQTHFQNDEKKIVKELKIIKYET